MEKATKTGRKRFMLSGAVVEAAAAETSSSAEGGGGGGGVAGATAVVKCRLFQRGDGWETRQERTLCAAAAGTGSGGGGDGVADGGGRSFI